MREIKDYVIWYIQYYDTITIIYHILYNKSKNIETDGDWHDFMDKCVPGIRYDVSADFSKECLVYIGTLPAQDIYSEGFDIKGLSIINNKLEVQYTGIGNGIYAQDDEGYTNCFINIVKVDKKDLPGNIENVYHKNSVVLNTNIIIFFYYIAKVNYDGTNHINWIRGRCIMRNEKNMG